MDEGESDGGVLASRANGRSSLPLVINRDSRKPLFNKPSHDNLRGGRGKAGNRDDVRPGLGRNALSGGNSVAADAGIDRPYGSISPTPSMTSSNGDGASRIPRPNSAAGPFSRARHQVSLADAYRMAKAEEERDALAPRTMRISPAPVDGSPSPAPRLRPLSQASDDGRMKRMLSRGPLDPGMNRRHSRPVGDRSPGDDTARSIDSISSSGSFDRRLSQYAEDQQQRRSPVPSSPRAGFLNPSMSESRTSELGKRLTKKSSNSSLGGSPRPPAFNKGHVPKGWVAHLLAEEEKRAASPKPDKMSWEEVADVPLPSVEGGGNPPREPTPPSSRPTSADAEMHSPNKSYAWQVDQDFTAGDLQISDSPRIQTNTAEMADLDARNSSDEAVFRHNQGIGIDEAGISSGEKHPGDSDPRFARGERENTKLEEIQKRELDAVRTFTERAERHQIRSKNTKLDDIRQQELDFGGGDPEPDDEEPPKNMKIDEIREREKEYMSKKALASNRLDDIREHNSMSTSLSPEPQPLRSKAAARETTPDPLPGSPLHQPTEEGERVPNTPVTIFRKPSGDKEIQPVEDVHVAKHSRDTSKAKPGSTHARSDSRDLLRLLARAASTSPAPETNKENIEPEETSQKASTETETKNSRSRHSRNSSGDERRTSTITDAQETDKAKSAVGLAGSRRAPSADSTKDKRSSRALSDNDPTDRIEGEMKLFAPTDNQSERGSVRAPSVGPPSGPPSDDEEEDGHHDETPRPIKKDPLSMPTPQITGAYVETPATARVEDRQKEKTGTKLGLAEDKAAPGPSTSAADGPRSRPRSRLFLTETQDQQQDNFSKAPLVKQKAPASTLRRRRTRSLPRTRGPLINSAKPPTVKDDLLQIQRSYQIEDSTLDDFEELLNSEKLEQAPSTQINTILNEISTKRQELASKADSDKDNSELERYDRMSKTLKHGLLGIRTAKQGIERLEGNLVHTERPSPMDILESEDLDASALDSMSVNPSKKQPPKESVSSEKPTRHDHKHANHSDSCPDCVTSTTPPSNSLAYLHLPFPRLHHRQPFRFTLVGIAVLILSLWYAAETAVCAQYCRPETCSSANTPCVWSPSDPTWGHAIPVKLDQWIADGQGRQLTGHFAEEASDVYLDVWDWATGHDIRDVDIERLNVFDQRQHRRRLRKRGILKTPGVAESLEVKARWDALHQARLEVERREEVREEMREAGYDVDEGESESFGADERV